MLLEQDRSELTPEKKLSRKGPRQTPNAMSGQENLQPNLIGASMETNSPVLGKNLIYEFNAQKPIQKNSNLAHKPRKSLLRAITKKDQLTSLGGLHQFYLTKVFDFLRPEDLIFSVQKVCKKWRNILSSNSFWAYFTKSTPVPNFNFRFRFIGHLSKRRSKGVLSKVTSRITGEIFTIKTVNFKLINAETNDGVPASILREISCLSKNNNPLFNKIEGVQMFQEDIMICQRFYPDTLRDFISNRKSSEPKSFLGANGQGCRLTDTKLIVFQLLLA